MNTAKNILQRSFFLSLLLIFTFGAAPGLPNQIYAAKFPNPVIKIEALGCRADNLRNFYFADDFTAQEQLKICRSFEKTAKQLSAVVWSETLSFELTGLWRVLSTEEIILRRLPPKTSPKILAVADAAPSFKSREKFMATVFINPQKSLSKSFSLTLMHELRHVYDFYQTWHSKSKLSLLEIERRGFSLMAKLASESAIEEFDFPPLWNRRWNKLSKPEINSKIRESVDKYLAETKEYQHLLKDRPPIIDFSWRALPNKSLNS